MQELSSSRVKTFTIGTYDDRNEADDAKRIANHLGTDHTELYIDDTDALKLVDSLSDIWDEPFADSSQIPMLIVSQLAKSNVTVALSGDGGDELFAGYKRYSTGPDLWENLKSKPDIYKKAVNKMKENKSAKALINGFDYFLKYEAGIFEQVKLWADIYRIDRKDDLYDFSLSSWNDLNNILTPDYILNVESPRFNDAISHIENMMLTDQLNYLPNDNLTKVDRASMHHSLEVRSPLLDFRIAELSWQIPDKEKLIDGVGKIPLREILYKYVPPDILDKPKRGFAVPVNDWILKDLKEWVDELLDPVKMKNDGILNHKYISEYWARIKRTNFLQSKKLWTIVMFQSWLRNQ
jgi:asparagine synthase (glutamine-hydrolysing)